MFEDLENSGTRERWKENQAIMGFGKTDGLVPLAPALESHMLPGRLGLWAPNSQSGATVLHVKMLRFSRRFCLNKGVHDFKNLKITQKDKPTFMDNTISS